MAKEDEGKAATSGEGKTADAAGKSVEAPERTAEALKEQPKSKSASKVRSAAERLRRNPWR